MRGIVRVIHGFNAVDRVLFGALAWLALGSTAAHGGAPKCGREPTQVLAGSTVVALAATDEAVYAADGNAIRRVPRQGDATEVAVLDRPITSNLVLVAGAVYAGAGNVLWCAPKRSDHARPPWSRPHETRPREQASATVQAVVSSSHRGCSLRFDRH